MCGVCKGVYSERESQALSIENGQLVCNDCTEIFQKHFVRILKKDEILSPEWKVRLVNSEDKEKQ